MNPIQIISASAGSGKTYRLAQVLVECVSSGQARPEGLIATTFTRKAAAELEGRARRALLRAGLNDAAQRLAASRIGTVNSVCARLVGDAAFDLGLSPDLRVLDAEQATAALRQACHNVITLDELDEMAAFKDLLIDFDGNERIYEIQDFARANGLGGPELKESARRSVESFLGLLGSPAKDGAAFDAVLAKACREFVVAVAPRKGLTKKTGDSLNKVQCALQAFDAGSRPKWADWGSLAALEVGKGERGLEVPVCQAAAAHDRHPELRRDAVRAIELCFDIAARSLERYAQYKREIGATDFTDQEVLALELLDEPAVRERISDEVDLVLVDEFQDTSPLQLALFLKLAGIVKRNVWVGDQKQAIYGFRGSDPALMDAAIETLLADGDLETLSKSWRSRSDLVSLTSDLFTAAFAPHGIAARRVELKPARGTEATGLGPTLERWVLDGKNKDDKTGCLANALREFLADSSVRVRELATGEARLAGPRDIAVLCRTNKTAEAVAEALEASGIRAVLAQTDFASRIEGRLLVAGLRLWVDTRDALALAELGRLLDATDDGNAWLASVLQEPYGAAFAKLPAVERITSRRTAAPTLGPVAALDAVAEDLGLRELCLGWGNFDERMRTVEALRSRAVRHAAACAEEGAAATPLSFVTSLESETDQGPQPADGVDAVVVSTWHGAKGLEWPVTVLFELDSKSNMSRYDVSVESDAPTIRLDAPLEKRWICFWPGIYHGGSKSTPFYTRLSAHPLNTAHETRKRREEVRLTYVGFTRARDRLVLAAPEGKLCAGGLSNLVDDQGKKLIIEDEHGLTVAGKRVKPFVRRGVSGLGERAQREPGCGPAAAGPRAHPAAYLRPSAVDIRGECLEPTTIGSRLPIGGKPDMANLGSALHGFLAGDRREFDRSDRTQMAESLLVGWGVRASLEPDSLLACSDAFNAWVLAKWPDALWRREWPIRQRLAGGTILAGAADLVLETADGLVIVDHKSFPGRWNEALERARTHAGQLWAYGEAASAATGKRFIGAFIHLPTMGVVIPVTRRAQAPVSI